MALIVFGSSSSPTPSIGSAGPTGLPLARTSQAASTGPGLRRTARRRDGSRRTSRSRSRIDNSTRPRGSAQLSRLSRPRAHPSQRQPSQRARPRKDHSPAPWAGTITRGAAQNSARLTPQARATRARFSWVGSAGVPGLPLGDRAGGDAARPGKGDRAQPLAFTEEPDARSDLRGAQHRILLTHPTRLAPSKGWRQRSFRPVECFAR